MSKPKKERRVPEDVESLTGDDVMRLMFGKKAQERLKREARGDDEQDQTETPIST